MKGEEAEMKEEEKVERWVDVPCIRGGGRITKKDYYERDKGVVLFYSPHLEIWGQGKNCHK